VQRIEGARADEGGGGDGEPRRRRAVRDERERAVQEQREHARDHAREQPGARGGLRVVAARVAAGDLDHERGKWVFSTEKEGVRDQVQVQVQGRTSPTRRPSSNRRCALLNLNLNLNLLPAPSSSAPHLFGRTP